MRQITTPGINFMECKKKHLIECIDGSKKKLTFEAGGELLFFSGKLYRCRRKKCGWEHYEGPAHPYKKVKKYRGEK